MCFCYYIKLFHLFDKFYSEIMSDAIKRNMNLVLRPLDDQNKPEIILTPFNDKSLLIVYIKPTI